QQSLRVHHQHAAVPIKMVTGHSPSTGIGYNSINDPLFVILGVQPGDFADVQRVAVPLYVVLGRSVELLSQDEDAPGRSGTVETTNDGISRVRRPSFGQRRIRVEGKQGMPEPVEVSLERSK